MASVLQTARQLVNPILSIRNWKVLGKYVGLSGENNISLVSDIKSLSEFIDSRASHVAQSSLYGYLKTRAGTRFPELFENPDILKSVNIAKWHIWIACVSDLTIFIATLARQSDNSTDDVISIMTGTFDQIIDRIGIPDEAGSDFAAAVAKARQRIADIALSDSVSDDDIFSQSPQALFYWSPIADELKDRDETIVRNSIRFRWIEVRRSCRKLIKFEQLFLSAL
ncbi:MAG: esterase [Gammaproteobacteria bacterium]|nr:esterase [Gammaproteobacteria bacterium]